LKIDKTHPTSESQEQLTCPLCDEPVDGNLGPHIRQTHGEEAFRQAVLTAKERGMPDPEIGARYGVSFNTAASVPFSIYDA